MTSTQRAIAKLPPHLRRYVVAQDYAAYTPRDHAVWRHILRKLTTHLTDRAHPSYLRGLAATGIHVERIPSLDEMNDRLADFGWSAVAVRGFIPPAVFTELQGLKVLAIASDIRSHEHVAYTPAPDIVHESAGHAPILADRRYAEYLQRCGVIGFKAIASAEDGALFEAIRDVSITKEDPAATPEDVSHSEERLAAAAASARYVSESTRASRLYWWTAEYGLVGELERPRIYGAGLLSSIGEAQHCLTPAVRKIPLSVACTQTAYDITRMQPQLFVARDFDHLFEVLESFETQLAWKRGGDHGLDEAIRARSLNHLVLEGGLELSGRVVSRIDGTKPVGPRLSSSLALVAGPVLVSRGGKAEGKPWIGPAVVAFGDERLPGRGAFDVTFATGIRLAGFAVGGHEVVNLRGELAGRPLDLPSRALLFAAPGLPSVAGGPADPGAWDRWFGELEAFGAGDGEARAQAHRAALLPDDLAALYRTVRELRESGKISAGRLRALANAAEAQPEDWLLRHEIEELRAFHGN